MCNRVFAAQKKLAKHLPIGSINIAMIAPQIPLLVRPIERRQAIP